MLRLSWEGSRYTARPMCGICGILTFDQAAATDDVALAVGRMTRLLERRGPDAEGFWLDPAGRLRLGFRRLAILDLSPAGDQPMVAHDHSSVVVMNGEIYNYRDLRRELESAGLSFRSRSDTEVLLAALGRWGLDTLPRLNGMFAFAWYQMADRSLVLARDHAGIKPLYTQVVPGRGLTFASQLNALLATPWGKQSVRPEVLKLFLQLHHIPAPYGFLEETEQVEPGGFWRIDAAGRIEKQRWWRLPRRPQVDLRGEAAHEALSAALDAAVARQRLADVPLGVFLSGGVDSPLITAVARRQVGKGLKALTIANPGWGQDESADAAVLGKHLEVDFRCHAITAEEALAAIAQVQGAQHEPFADFSILPTLLISRHARAEMTVALSGDGGDELFFGYERPLSLLRSAKSWRWPWSVRAGLYGASQLGLGPRRSDVMLHDSPGAYYLAVNSRFSAADLARLAPDLPELPADFDLYDCQASADPQTLADFSRHAEFYGQLQRGLKKVDMASMWHSLEVRVPLLDREVIEVALRIDPLEHMAGGRRKALLHDQLGRHVPPGLISKAKRGFGVPLGAWLRGPWRGLAEETLLDGELFPAGVFRRPEVERLWRAHQDGVADHKWQLWTLMTLQWWATTHLRRHG